MSGVALYAWRLWAWPDQLPPPEGWRVWLLRGGRGSGKTRAGAEWVRGLAEAGSCRCPNVTGPVRASREEES